MEDKRNEKALNVLASSLGSAYAQLSIKAAKMEVVIESLQAENSELKLKLKMKEGGTKHESTQTNTKHK